ncbi:unnamed protein product [Heligmosomoides polygyrus]|uniref:Metalloendopeptidase n=1 Tax=Heligmosomoides polygyrus TaxID=6339 RepID=A0A183FUM2_HELPZ|nr:unnamed protein product [Heligmosomoides polygyrus]
MKSTALAAAALDDKLFATNDIRTQYGEMTELRIRPKNSILGEKVKTVFRKGAKLWRDNTCIDIYEDTCGLSPDRIRVITDDGCSSNIGRTGGEQEISLGEGCETVANAAHELGHALGFYHTQSRHDRFEYITVNFQNIYPEHQVEFLSRTSNTNYNYGLPLDFGSIMLYDANA